MADIVTPDVRSRMMAGIKGKDTKPELLIRKLLFAKGFRYRLHVKDLPGKPDLVFPRYRAVVFIHGCFWHRHGRCPLTRWPKSKLEFWKPKLEANKKRDRKNLSKLHSMHWEVLVIWECEIRNRDSLIQRLRTFLT